MARRVGNALFGGAPKVGSKKGPSRQAGPSSNCDSHATTTVGKAISAWSEPTHDTRAAP